MPMREGSIQMLVSHWIKIQQAVVSTALDIMNMLVPARMSV
jgi:hypothetical protein